MGKKSRKRRSSSGGSDKSALPSSGKTDDAPASKGPSVNPSNCPETSNEVVSAKLECNIAAACKQDAVSSGLSWGAAFAAASSVKPCDGLDEDFLRRTCTEEKEDEGLALVSKLALDTIATRDVDKLKQTFAVEGVDVDVFKEDSREKAGTCHTRPDDTCETKRERKKRERKKRKRTPKKDTDHEPRGGEAPPKRQCESETSQNHAGQQKSIDYDCSDNVSDGGEAPLEGRMVLCPNDPTESMMVLIDQSSKIVYSALERNSDGARLVVGRLIGDEVHLDLSGDNDVSQPLFPYQTEPDDHCETPLDAYVDVLPILDHLRGIAPKAELRIYDPYYCAGSVVKHLGTLGYTNTYNEKMDCYSAWENSTCPQFDVFLTNPPYSGDHTERLMQHVTSPAFGPKPWLLLMPNWVHKKEYYINMLRDAKIVPFYLVPKKRYVYRPPANFREKKVSDVHKKSSPFVSMWYIWAGTMERTSSLIEFYQKKKAIHNKEEECMCDLARSRSALRDLRRKGTDGGKKRKKKGKNT